ncbi:MAG: glycosyltransferase family 2 protein [Chloroflexota bacterium]|nr:glycosyltransferase family 2 protein [Chloroflexota bacterium]MDE2841176.1 glycosyltransferase family 2 protein [Chloroflexota bacterium]MDE2930137.1 glycosyltransferase family 2 protein [Chloroflexota bacterium]
MSMKTPPLSAVTVSLVLPALNEADNIAATLDDCVQTLRRVAQDYEIIVVDNDSTDDTADIVRQFQSENARVHLIHQPIRGYGSAIWTGLKAAQLEIVGWRDSDTQYRTADIVPMLKALDTYDVVVGHRVQRRDPSHRLLFALLWNVLNRVLFGFVVHDMDCGCKIFRREVVDTLDIKAAGAVFNVEFLVQAKRAGFRVGEVSISHLPRHAGENTGGSLRVILRAMREVLRLRWRLLREPRPIRNARPTRN